MQHPNQAGRDGPTQRTSSLFLHIQKKTSLHHFPNFFFLNIAHIKRKQRAMCPQIGYEYCLGVRVNDGLTCVGLGTGPRFTG